MTDCLGENKFHQVENYSFICETPYTRNALSPSFSLVPLLVKPIKRSISLCD